MQLKEFRAGRYDNGHVLIQNSDNEKLELFTEEEFEIVKFLKENESETLLALLLPNIGIAKKHHILLCLKVLAKLKKIQIIDYFSILGKNPVSQTGTLEMAQAKGERIEFHGLKSLAGFIFGFFEKIFSGISPTPMLMLSFLLTALSVMFFPFEMVDSELAERKFVYTHIFLTIYVVGCLCFSLRSVLQSVYLKTIDQEARDKSFSLYFPFIALYANPKEVSMAGFQSRLQMGILGICSPMILASFITMFTLWKLIPGAVGYVGYATCIASSLIFLCPIFSFDAADILHVIFYKDKLTESISTQMKMIFQTRGSLSKAMLVSLLFTLFWLFIWLDSLRVFWEMIASQVIADFSELGASANFFGSVATLALLLALIFTPVLVFIWSIVRERIRARSRRLVVNSEKIKDSLSFEERMSALEKIPLFAYLKDQERLSLISEMSISYYKDGDFLVHQGEVGKEFLILVKGHAAAIFVDAQGKTIQLASLQEGDAFGEIALIDDVPRTASIVSEGGCLVLVLKKEGFDRFALSLGSSDRLKTMIRLTSFFRRHPLFSKLNAKDQALLIDSFRFHTIMSGDEIIDPESDENFYVIYSGKVRVDTGDDATETFLELDDCFGYTSALRAKYFAVEGTGLLSVRKEQFHSLIWEKLVERPDLFF